MSVAYRYLRRKLPGFWPETGLGRFTAYSVLLTLACYLLMQIFGAFAATKGLASTVAGWAMLLIFVSGGSCLLLLLRWIRKSVMWRLRNRLIITYLFIGVIPVLLVALMTFIAANLFLGQFVSFALSSEIENELKRLEGANTAIALAFAKEPRGHTVEIARGIATGSAGYGIIQAWQGNSSVVLYRADGAPELGRPEWLKSDFCGMVVENNGLSMRCAKMFPEQNVTVISQKPLDKPALEHLASTLGVVNFYSDDAELEIQPGDDKVVTQTGRKPGLNIQVPADESKTGAAPVLSAGKLPDSKGWYDRDTVSGTPLMVTDWATGKRDPRLVTIRSRLSMVYDNLFRTIGDYSGIILFVLGAVAVIFGVIELVALIIGVRLTRTITRSVAKLYEATESINRGRLHHRIKVDSHDQLAALERSFNSMAESLEGLIEEQKEKQRLQSELAIAKEVQDQLFPRHVAELESLEVHGVCKPARSVSGDYYDFVPSGDHQMILAVGDVSGKGISAALLMATIQSAVRAYEFGRMTALVPVTLAAYAPATIAKAEISGAIAAASGNGHSPAHIMSVLNRQLFRSTPSEKYATLFLGMYNGSTRTLTYANGGHLPPLVLRNDGTQQRLESSGMVVGLFDDLPYEARSISMQPGDIFVAYSDGITEPENEFGEFGEDRMVALVRENAHEPLARISEIVTGAVADWIGSNEQPDDVTLVLARVR